MSVWTAWLWPGHWLDLMIEMLPEHVSQQFLGLITNTALMTWFITLSVFYWVFIRPSRYPGGRVQPPPVCSPDLMEELLHPDTIEFRRQAKAFFVANDLFHVQQSEFADAILPQRHLALRRARAFARSGLVSVQNIISDPLRFIAAHEVLGMIDGGTAYLFSVHFNLWGGSVLRLASPEQQSKWVPAIDSMDEPGCFALTELAHGVNSGFFLDTTAVYDEREQVFILHTPNTGAQKNWISLSATHARYGVVFAQLHVRDKQEGVHAFIVELRDAKGRACPGVRIEDVGPKPVLNANDNGRLFFDHVRVPRSQLLARYSQVAADGTFTCDFDKPRTRFLRVADQLMSGRICIAATALTLGQTAVLLAVRYGAARTQVRPKGQPPLPLWDLMTHRLALVPAIAEMYALTIGTKYVQYRYAHRSDEDAAEVTRLVCAAKGHNTLRAVAVSATAKAVCGAQSLISANRLCELNDMALSLVVVEGDSMLLGQKVAKELLELAYKGKHAGLVYVKAKLQTSLLNARVRKLGSNVRSAAFIPTLLALRQHVLTHSLGAHCSDTARKYRLHLLDAWAKHHNHEAMQLHTAFTERLMYQRMSVLVNAVYRKVHHQVLAMLMAVYGLSCIKRDMAWFLCNTSLSKEAGLAIEEELRQLCLAITDLHALVLCRGFGIPEELLAAAPIAHGEEWIDLLA